MTPDDALIFGTLFLNAYYQFFYKKCLFYGTFFVSVPGSSVGGITSDATFASLAGAVSEPTLRGIADMGFTKMTAIQAKAVPHLLEGR